MSFKASNSMGKSGLVEDDHEPKVINRFSPCVEEQIGGWSSVHDCKRSWFPYRKDSHDAMDDHFLSMFWPWRIRSKGMRIQSLYVQYTVYLIHILMYIHIQILTQYICIYIYYIYISLITCLSCWRVSKLRASNLSETGNCYVFFSHGGSRFHNLLKHN